MPPPSVRRSAEKSSLRNSALFTSALNSVFTPVIAVNRYLRHFLDEARDVPRVGNEHVLSAQRHEHEAIGRQREDVIQRQRRDDDVARVAQERLHPGPCLEEIGDDVAMKQHRALGHAGRAARVLQEGDVVGADRAQSRARACGLRRARPTARIAPGIENAGTTFFTRRNTKSTTRPLKLSSSPTDVITGWRIFVLPRTWAKTLAKFSRQTMTSAPESFSWCSSSRAV